MYKIIFTVFLIQITSAYAYIANGKVSTEDHEKMISALGNMTYEDFMSVPGKTEVEFPCGAENKNICDRTPYVHKFPWNGPFASLKFKNRLARENAQRKKAFADKYQHKFKPMTENHNPVPQAAKTALAKTKEQIAAQKKRLLRREEALKVQQVEFKKRVKQKAQLDSDIDNATTSAARENQTRDQLIKSKGDLNYTIGKITEFKKDVAGGSFEDGMEELDAQMKLLEEEHERIGTSLEKAQRAVKPMKKPVTKAQSAESLKNYMQKIKIAEDGKGFSEEIVKLKDRLRDVKELSALMSMQSGNLAKELGIDEGNVRLAKYTIEQMINESILGDLMRKQGQKILVEACNTASVCSQVSDSSPRRINELPAIQEAVKRIDSDAITYPGEATEK